MPSITRFFAAQNRRAASFRRRVRSTDTCRAEVAARRESGGGGGLGPPAGRDDQAATVAATRSLARRLGSVTVSTPWLISARIAP